MECPQCGKESDGAECPSCGAAMDEQNPKWYAEGIVHLTKEKQYAFAHELLAEGLEKFPDSAMLWYNGGVLEELLGSRPKAIKCYEESLRLRPNSEKPRLALERLLGRSLQPAAPVAPPPAVPAAAVKVQQAAPAPVIPKAPAPAAAPAATPVAATPSAGETLAAQISAVIAEDAAVVTPPVERTAQVKASNPPTAPVTRESLDLSSLPQLPEDTSPSFDVFASNQRWTMISRLAGITSAITFIGLMVFLVLAKMPSLQQVAAILFVVDLLLFLVASPLYFVGKSSVVVTRRQRV